MAKKAYIGVNGVARKIKKGYVGVANFVPRALPSGYTQVEYIESNKTQYIDTGFKPNQNTRVVMDVQATASNTYAYFGGRTGSTSKSFTFFMISATKIRSDYGATEIESTITNPTDRVIIDVNKNTFSFGSITGTHSSATFQSDYSLYLLAVHNGGSASYPMPAKLYSCQVYDNGTLIRDFVPCANSAGTAGLYDVVNGVFYGSAGSGTFTAGTSTYASYARKIKKAYIGIGGVARPCWSGGELAYYGTITPLSEPCQVGGTACIGDYALFGISYGKTTGKKTGKVEAYNTSLAKTIATALNPIRDGFATTSNASYAIFAGGSTVSYAHSNVVEAYDSSLTKKTATTLSTQITTAGATKIGNYAVVGGGNRDGNTMSNIVDAYDAALTKTKATNLSVNMNSPAAVSVGNYGLFCAGYANVNQDPTTTVNAYNSSLTRSIPTALSVACLYPQGASIGNKYALVAHYYNKSNMTSSVDVYDSSLTRKSAPALSKAGYNAGVSCDKYALFVGGNGGKTIDCYDESLTRTSPVELSVGRDAKGIQNGSHILIGGGYTGSAYSDVVDVYLTE